MTEITDRTLQSVWHLPAGDFHHILLAYLTRALFSPTTSTRFLCGSQESGCAVVRLFDLPRGPHGLACTYRQRNQMDQFQKRSDKCLSGAFGTKFAISVQWGENAQNSQKSSQSNTIFVGNYADNWSLLICSQVFQFGLHETRLVTISTVHSFPTPTQEETGKLSHLSNMSNALCWHFGVWWVKKKALFVRLQEWVDELGNREWRYIPETRTPWAYFERISRIAFATVQKQN